MTIPALVMRAERSLVARLVERRAFSTSTAVPLLTDSFIKQRRLAALVRAGVINEERPGQYWLDQAAWRTRQESRRRRMLAVLAALVAALVGLLLLQAR